jgi:hypothetical protein
MNQTRYPGRVTTTIKGTDTSTSTVARSPQSPRRSTHAETLFHRSQFYLRSRLGISVRQGAWPGCLRLCRSRKAQAHRRWLRNQKDHKHQHKGAICRIVLLWRRSCARPNRTDHRRARLPEDPNEAMSP